MNTRLKSIAFILAATIMLLNFPTRTLAVDVGDQVHVHGYGGWAWGRTSHNDFETGVPGGSWRNVYGTLNVTAQPHEQLLLVIQPFWSIRGAEQEIKLDLSFAQWTFNDLVKFKAGLMKQSFGIYSEIYDVGTLRPFYGLPPSVYGSTALVSENMIGAGLTGNLGAGNWNFQYDIYGGDIVFEKATPWAVLTGSAVPGDPIEMFEDHIKNVFGGRLVAAPPVDGLSAGVSGYTGTSENGQFRSSAIGTHAEYQYEGILLRTEYVHKIATDETVNAAYAELAYRFLQHYQLATRLEIAHSDPHAPLSTSTSVKKHKGFSAGANYWLLNNLVLKASYHLVEGNRLAFESEDNSAVAAGTLHTRTHLFETGVQFSF